LKSRDITGKIGNIEISLFSSLLVKGLRWCLREEITDHSLGEGELFTGTISRPLSWTKGIHSFEKE